MRATVREVATFFPTAIISGRGRQKVSFDKNFLLSYGSLCPALPSKIYTVVA